MSIVHVIQLIIGLVLVYHGFQFFASPLVWVSPLALFVIVFFTALGVVMFSRSCRIFLGGSSGDVWVELGRATAKLSKLLQSK